MYIGLDLGTTALKALLIDDEQRLIASATCSIETRHPAAGWAEQNPSDWIDAARQALARLRDAAPAAFTAARAIGLSGQMHTLVVLDAALKPLRPAILWNDTRGDAWCQTMMRDHPEVAAISGVRPMPSFTAAKAAWLRENEPDCFRATRHILLPKDYLRLWLTGNLATDPSDAGATQLFDQAARRWSPVIAARVGLDEACLPPVLEGSDIAGSLRSELAAEFGLGEIAVVCGGGDAATGALGTGCIEQGAAMLSLGTGAVYLVAQGQFRPLDNDSVHNFAHCLPGKWYHMAAMLNCGSALDWACRILGGRKPAEMLAEIEATRRGPSSVLFLPYLDGVRTPHCNAGVRGGFFGFERATDPVDLAQAVVEGITFSLADADRTLLAAGNRIEAPLLLGGGAKSAYWSQLIATVLDRPVRRVADAETGSALGACRLAMIGTGAGSPGEICQPPPAEYVEPDPAFTNAYRERLEVFRTMYKSVETYAAF